MGPLAVAGIAGGMSLLGAIAGKQGSQTDQSYRTEVAPETELEKQSNKLLSSGLTDMQGLVNAGPGMQDVTSGLDSQRSLADMLSRYSQGGFLPDQQMINQQHGFAQQLFAPQQEGLNQNFTDASMYANRNAARMGRGGNDPILMNKLLQEKTRQQSMLNAQIGQQGMQMALQQPMQQLGFAQQLAQVRSGLATQAMQNRQALMSMGSQLKGQDQNFRAGTASREMSTTGGGGMGGMISGALAGAGTGLGVGALFGGFGKSSGTQDVGAESPANSYVASNKGYLGSSSMNMGLDTGFVAGENMPISAPRSMIAPQASQPAAQWRPSYYGGKHGPMFP